jgi:hypothetical protein
MNNKDVIKKYIKSLLFEQNDMDYRMDHTAPDKESGAPLYDLSSIFPGIYENPSYYLTAHSSDSEALSIIRSYRDKPNKTVVIYRAVIYNNYKEKELGYYRYEKLSEYKSYAKRFIKIPSKFHIDIPREVKSNYGLFLDYIDGELSELEPGYLDGSLKKEYSEYKKSIRKMFVINPGDWVAITKEYAEDHGKGHSVGSGYKYKIVSMRVKASQVYNSGDSIQEWGYDPS